jgi:DNA mismatch endonuclease (patch repair protein)
MDVFTPEKRSEVMSRIRGRDTKPELALRSMLHRLSYRFTVNGPKNKSLPAFYPLEFEGIRIQTGPNFH